MKAYEAFVVYRDMGPSRSLTKAAQILNTKKTGIRDWSAKWGWVERAQAWDDELDRRQLEKQAAEVLEMRDRHIEIAQGMQGVALKRLKLFDEVPVSMAGPTMVRLLRDGTTMERLNRGEPGELVEHRAGEELDLSNLDVEELLELKRLNRKARGGDDG